jgi:2-polyprenyl-3-methyl-5-hydroxy-6-metoxy-1,4-benzoquinol methylase
MVCKLCNSKNFFFLDKIYDFEYDLRLFGNYFFCKNCNTIFKDLKKFDNKILYNQNKYIPTSQNIFYSSLKRIYANFEAKKILKHQKILSNKKVLDIGCGNAYLLRSLAKLKIAKYYGVDLNIKFKSNKTVKVYKKDLKNFEIIKKINPDILIINNFFEHFQDIRQINQLFRSLKKKTSIIIFTPNLNCKGRKIFKNFWSGYHSPRHFFVFSQKSFLIIKKKFSLKIKYTSNYYDPFTNLISIKNKIKYLLYKRKYLDIFLNFPLFVKGLFSDLDKNNRLFLILEKK